MTSKNADIMLVKGRKKLLVKGIAEVKESSEYLTLLDAEGGILFHTNKPEDWDYLYRTDKVKYA